MHGSVMALLYHKAEVKAKIVTKKRKTDEVAEDHAEA
jgi:hypothetical protein